jgi:hypothetical protein
VTNPYTPPGAPVKDPPGPPQRSSLQAIGVGFTVDIVATVVFSLVFGVVAGAMLSSGGESLDQVADMIDRSAGLQLVGLAGGLACTALGGYAGARFANHSEYATAFAVGVASLIFGEVMMAFASVPPDLWLRLLSDALVIPFALVGGHLRAQQKAAAA